MLTVTETAREQVLQYFQGNEIKPIRVFASNGCGGRQLAMAVDDARPDDTVYPYGELTFLIEPSLLEEAGPVTIDFAPQGFVIDSNIKPGDGSGCGCCSSSGTCGG